MVFCFKLYSDKLAHLERCKKGSDDIGSKGLREREAMRGVKRKEKNERPQIICLVFLCACVQERAWLTLSYPPLKHTSTPSLSLSLSLFQYPLPKAVSLFLSFPHILLNSCLKFSFTYHYILLCSTTISLHKLQFTNSLPFSHSVLTLFLAM